MSETLSSDETAVQSLHHVIQVIQFVQTSSYILVSLSTWTELAILLTTALAAAISERRNAELYGVTTEVS
jgi:hypothetical protein